MRLSALAWLGFDLDHTLVRYRLPQHFELIHGSLATALARLGPFELRELCGGGAKPATAAADSAAVVPAADYAAYGSIISKGLVFDFASGAP